MLAYRDMKKLLFIIIVLAVGSWLVKSRNKVSDSTVVTKPPEAGTSNPTQEIPKNLISVPFGTDLYAVSYFRAEGKSIRLIENFSEKKSSLDLMKLYECEETVNGGFYDTDDTPIGLWQSDQEKLGGAKNNSLLDGFFWKTLNGTYGIGSDYPEETQFAIQSGPVLMKDSIVRTLQIRNDEPARRIISFIDNNRSLYFAVFYDKENTYSGPKLGDLPQVLAIFAQKAGLKPSHALNLDGGSASVFITPSIRLEELTHAGSIFCVK